MPSLRIYFDAFVKNSVKEIKVQILGNKDRLAKIENNQIINTGFYKKKILEKIEDDYYIADFFEIGQKKIPSIQTELAYFNYLDTLSKSEIRQHPTLIKIVFNPRKKIMCFFTRAKISNKVSDKLLQRLNKIYSFNFIYNPIIYTYKENKLNALVNALDIKDLTLLTAWDYENQISIKNPKKISETNKYLELIKEQSKGNWTHLKVPFDDLDIVLKINKTTKNFITFDNNYKNDTHLVKAIDFIVNKILEIEDFSGKRQTLLNSFY